MDSTNTAYPKKNQKAVVYNDQTGVQANMIGWLKQTINPTEKQDSRKRYRYIPGDLSEFMILNEKSYICHYNALQKKYLEDTAKCASTESVL